MTTKQTEKNKTEVTHKSINLPQLIDNAFFNIKLYMIITDKFLLVLYPLEMNENMMVIQGDKETTSHIYYVTLFLYDNNTLLKTFCH